MGQGQSEETVYGPNMGEEGTMKAIVMECPGKISEARIASVYLPKPEAAEIRVKVFCAGINSVDFKRCNFKDAEFPCILGADVAGVVDLVGADVTNLKVGDKVYYHSNVKKQYGAFAEYAITTASTAVLMPEGISFAEAAAIPCSGWTAYIALYYKLKVYKGQSILITGASGGVGCYAIQLAKLSGLTVFALCQSHKMDFVRSFQPDYVLPSDKPDFALSQIMLATNGELVDHVLDTLGPVSSLKAVQYLKLHGSICSLAGLVNDNVLFDKGISVHYINLGGMLQSTSEVPRELLTNVARELGSLFSSKQLRVPLMEICEMPQTLNALETVRNGSVQGKLVTNIIPTAKQAEVLAELTPQNVQKVPFKQKQQQAFQPGLSEVSIPKAPSTKTNVSSGWLF